MLGSDYEGSHAEVFRAGEAASGLPDVDGVDSRFMARLIGGVQH